MAEELQDVLDEIDGSRKGHYPLNDSERRRIQEVCRKGRPSTKAERVNFDRFQERHQGETTSDY